MNPIGVVAGATAFLSIWLGHVSVRRVEAASPTIWLPMAVLLGAGALLEWFSASTADILVSASAGILGVTFLWDAFEVGRQQARVRSGRAPANPANPRHRRMLAESGSQAILLNLLKREPVGRAVSLEEAIEAVRH